MIPGVLMYRALFAFIEMHGVVGEVTVGMNNAIKASLAIICIALGVAVPNLFSAVSSRIHASGSCSPCSWNGKAQRRVCHAPCRRSESGWTQKDKKGKNHARDTHE